MVNKDEYIFRVQGMCLVAGRASSAPPNPLAGFEGPLRGGVRGKGKEGREGKVKEEKRWKGREN